jgi:hypothetical protein
LNKIRSNWCIAGCQSKRLQKKDDRDEFESSISDKLFKKISQLSTESLTMGIKKILIPTPVPKKISIKFYLI